MNRTAVFFVALAVLLMASRMCHVSVLWEGDTLPLAAARQMTEGKVLYRAIWFDKPPLVPAFDLLFGARPGWPLRLADALYALLACWIAYAFARDLWSEREGIWAAGLLGFFLIFGLPSAVIPVASDLMMVAPHLAAVWMAWKRRPFWSGVWAGVAFWVSPKGVLVAAACVLWYPAGIPLLAAGFAAVSGAAAVWLWASGALAAYWEEVWIWGRLYAANSFLQSPLREGLARTLNWMGFHAAIVVAAARFGWALAHGQLRAAKGNANRSRAGAPTIPRPRIPGSWPLFFSGTGARWIAWLVLSFIGLAAGLRFFPRYYFMVLPVVVLMAARGFTLLGRKREFVALLLLIPATRFGPSYLTALENPAWRDTAMDRDSRSASTLIRGMARPGDTLFVWGYRPEIFIYTRLSAGTIYLDSQPLSGVPADRHLTQSEPIETESATRRRTALTRTSPNFIVDGLGLYNPRLAITEYPDLRQWLAPYHEVARTADAIIYRR